MTGHRRPARARSWLLATVIAALAALAEWARRTRIQTGLDPTSMRGERYVASGDGTPLHVELDGSPDADLTVLFVHGLLARSAEFDAQWDRLRRTARLVRFDHRGHGRSGRTRGPVTIRQLGQDVAAVLDSVPAGPVVIVAHSMGGMAVLSLAAQRPDLFRGRVVGVALLATAAGHDAAGHPVETAVRRVARAHVLTPLLWLLRVTAPLTERFRPRGTRATRQVVRALLFGRDDATRDLVAQAQRMLEEPPLRTLTALHGSILRLDERAGLRVLRGIPTAVVVGGDDRLTRPAHSRAIAAELGGLAELRVIPGVGHALTQSAPDDVNDAIERLLRRSRRHALTKPSGSQTSPAVVT